MSCETILEQWFFMADHLGLDGKIKNHPFLAIGISDNKLVGLQFSSVKKFGNNKISYFSNNDLNSIISVNHKDGLLYNSQADSKLLYIFNFNFKDKYNFKLITKCNIKKWKEIISHLQKFIWEDKFINEIVNKWK